MLRVFRELAAEDLLKVPAEVRDKLKPSGSSDDETGPHQAKREVDDPHGLSPDRMHREVGVDLRNSSGPAGHCKLTDAVCGVADDRS